MLNLFKKKINTWPLQGGVHPPENKNQSTGEPIAKLPLPQQLILPLAQHAGRPAEPIVRVGDHVLKGQMIAQASGFVSASVHASTSGVVTAIEKLPVPHPSGLSDTCVVIDSDGQDKWCDLHPVMDYQAVPREKLVNIIRQSGVNGLGGAGFPTSVKLAPTHPVHTLIINGTECEPYITADDMQMRERAEDIVEGAAIMQYILRAEHCLMGIEDNKPEAIAAMQQAVASRKNMKVISFPVRYPSGDSKQLIRILTGKEMPAGTLSSDHGYLVHNTGTAAAVYDAVCLGIPLISRVTTLTGRALERPVNVNALLGTPVNDLLAFSGLQEEKLHSLVVGGPMMGFTLDSRQVPVTKTVNCLIASTHDESPLSPLPQPCIRCGFCAEACPLLLLPQQLYWYAQAENYTQAMHHNLFDCIECGACSYVCPSSIPLVQYYRAAKGAIRHQEAKKSKAERSKKRFEEHQVRIARETAEKEVRRKAHAEKAVRLKAARDSGETVVPDDPIQAAIDRVKAKKSVPSGQKKRAVGSVNTSQQKAQIVRLSMAKAQLKKMQRFIADESLATKDRQKYQSTAESLKQQIELLQKEINLAVSDIHKNKTGGSQQKPKSTAADTRRFTIELAVAKAALKKSERALAVALEKNDETTESFKEQVEECRQKIESLQCKIQQTTYQKPAEISAKPLDKKRVSTVNQSDELRQLKVQFALAQAARRKAEKALAQMNELSPEQQKSYGQALDEAKKNAQAVRQALDNYQKSHSLDSEIM
ncbi:Electron transport complex subunit RsxC [invertebrate metagenome]|uniref:Electron transport complex subunit RsxC n=1 Tax=invertebrate metagenome TaxID=1711999 RepID=A0A2H9TAG8_9ZZZZ